MEIVLPRITSVITMIESFSVILQATLVACLSGCSVVTLSDFFVVPLDLILMESSLKEFIRNISIDLFCWHSSLPWQDPTVKTRIINTCPYGSLGSYNYRIIRVGYWFYPLQYWHHGIWDSLLLQEINQHKLPGLRSRLFKL